MHCKVEEHFGQSLHFHGLKHLAQENIRTTNVSCVVLFVSLRCCCAHTAAHGEISAHLTGEGAPMLTLLVGFRRLACNALRGISCKQWLWNPHYSLISTSIGMWPFGSSALLASANLRVSTQCESLGLSEWWWHVACLPVHCFGAVIIACAATWGWAARFRCLGECQGPELAGKQRHRD